MFEGLKNARREFFDFFLPEWVDPLYLATVLLIFIVLYHWEWYQQWDDLPADKKGVLRALLFATTVLVVGSALKLAIGP